MKILIEEYKEKSLYNVFFDDYEWSSADNIWVKIEVERLKKKYRQRIS